MKTSLLIVSCILFGSQAFAEEKKSSDFSRPLYFDVVDNELKVKNPKLIYSLQKHDGKKLEIGNLIFDNDSFAATIENNELKFKWDTSLIAGGEISIINEQGKELWRHKTKPKDGQWSYSDLQDSDAPQWKSRDRVRFCIRDDIDKGYTNVCTQWYGIEITGQNLRLGLVKSSANPRIIFHNEEKKLEGQEEVALGAPVQFLAIIASGATYEFMSEPTPLIIKDMVESEKPGSVTLIGGLPAPTKLETTILDLDDEGTLTKALGFQKTIAARESLWKADLSLKALRLFVPGKSGGLFAYDLEIKNPPKEKDRRFVSEDALQGTYLSSDEMVFSDDSGKTDVWKFSAPEKFKINHATLEIPGEKTPHKSYLDIYRGGPREASLRLTAMNNTESGMMVWGEAHFSWWFNDIFGTQNYYLSKQRWGASARYFTSLSKMQIRDSNDELSDTNLTIMNVDLRYRFTPGLWERDETAGFILSYESMTLETFSVPKLGYGLFWARSMPKVFDDFFNLFPLMEYPKFVDMEYIQYSSSMDSNIALGMDYVLNFHGKVLWTPQFFGEAGFGAKGYSFENTQTGDAVKLIFFYATVGMGFNF